MPPLWPPKANLMIPLPKALNTTNTTAKGTRGALLPSHSESLRATEKAVGPHSADRRPFIVHQRTALYSAGMPRVPSSCSSAAAVDSSLASPKAGPMSCRPTGSPVSLPRPTGTDMPGMPARLAEMV